MAQSWPWTRGVDRSRPAARLSARERLGEALAEAQSSLEQFSGFALPSRGQRWLSAFGAWLQRALAAARTGWAQGPALGAARLRRVWTGRRAVVDTPVRGSPLRRAGPRFLTHLGMAALLLVLFAGGGFQGVLAQPVQTNQSAGNSSWQLYWSTNEAAGILDAYQSIPALPLVLRRARPNIAEPWPEVEEEPAGLLSRRAEVITYTVQSGDTLISIAVQYGVSIETLYWYNGLKSADLLSIDQVLRIPPVDGLLYKVKAGDTLDSIAEAFNVRKGNMIAYPANNLREPYTLVEGQEIYIPGASKPIPRPPTAPSARPFRLSAPGYASLPGGERFSWPASGHITDRFGWTGRRWHNAIDIAAPWGTPLYASAAGTVTGAGWYSGYGYMVEINHGDGWVTRYGHMAQQPEVSIGQWVERGQLIGYIGCTGNCTGPHVHFEIRYNGSNCNPLDYLQ